MSIRGINAEIDRIRQLSERELKDQTPEHASWHEKYHDSAYLYIGNLDRGLTEGDLITVFSQFGEILDVNLVRDKETGKSKGFGFLAYEDQRSTRYAIDNMIGFNLVGRPLKVDHVNSYRAPIVEDPEGRTDAEGNPIYVDYKATGAEGKGRGVVGVTESQKMLDKMGENRARVTAIRDKKWMIEDPELTKRSKKEEKRRHKKEKSSKSEGEKSERSVSRRAVKHENDDDEDRRRDGGGSREREFDRREPSRRRHRSRSRGGGRRDDGHRRYYRRSRSPGRRRRSRSREKRRRVVGLNLWSLVMAVNKKRGHPNSAARTRKESASSMDSSSDSSISDGEQIEATSEDAFEAAFRFEDMTDDDYHGVRMMITRLLDGKEYDVGSLAQCIVDQQNIGTIIKSGDENKAKDGDNDDAFCAVATILNPAQYSKEIKGMQQLVEHLRQQVDKHADSDEVKEAFGKMVSATGGIRCGIMINERMINLPSELVPGIHRVLKDDVAWSLSEEAHCPVEEKKYYKFTHLLFLTSYYVDPSSAPSKVMPGGKKVKAAKRKKARLEMEKKERRYICFEDEVFVDHAQWQVTWPFPRGDGIDPETRKMLARKRLLYCVKYDDWKTMVDQLA